MSTWRCQDRTPVLRTTNEAEPLGEYCPVLFAYRAGTPTNNMQPAGFRLLGHFEKRLPYAPSHHAAQLFAVA